MDEQEDSDIDLTDVQIEALRAQVARFDLATRKRGEAYFQQGRVFDVLDVGSGISALVVGGDHYECDWLWSQRGWRNDCACPVGIDCKHAYALALHILSRATTREEPAADASDSPVSDFAARLRGEGNPWRRREILRAFLTKAARSQPYDSRILHILDECDAESDAEVISWIVARRVEGLVGGAIPKELEPYRNRPDLQERLEQREQRRLTDDLMTWVAQRKSGTPRALRFVWNLLPSASGVSLTVEARLTTKRLQDAPGSYEQVRQLLSEAERKPGTLADDQLALLKAFFASGESASFGVHFNLHPQEIHPRTAIRMLRDAGLETPLMTWSTAMSPAISARSGAVPGAPLRLGSELVRILPAATAREDGARLQLACVWPDGHQQPLDEALHFPANSYSNSTSAVIAGGRFFTVAEEPPAHIIERFRTTGGLAIPKAQCAEVLAPLAHHYQHVRAALATHTQWLTGTPIFALDLRDDDWLQLRLFLHDGADPWSPHEPPPSGAKVFELTPGGRWQRWRDTAPETVAQEYEPIQTSMEVALDPVASRVESLADSEVWVEAPHPETVEPAMTWLTATNAAPAAKHPHPGGVPAMPGRDLGWWMRASAKRMAEFAELWETRPPNVRYFGTERVQRLLSGTHAVRPTLRITSSGLDWFGVSAQWESEGLSLSDADMAKLRSSASRFVKLASGWVRRDAVEAHDKASQLLADLGIEIGGGEQRLTLWQLAGAKTESIAALEQMGADREAIDALASLRGKLQRFNGVPQVKVPSTIKAELRPYQKQGFDFLAYVSSLGIGAVLADDMGLGKTLQALAWLQMLVTRDRKGGPSLVVCPTSVVHNWQREAAQFAPKLRVLALTRGEERHELRKEIGRFDLVITNYALLRRDIDQWKEERLRAVILDEAQNIKNPDAAISKAAFALHAQHRLALTGTPLENRPLDLWSISNFVNPGYLGNRSQFGVRFDRIDAAPHARTLLAAKLRPVLLRRLKREVAADLPDRIEERRDCELTDGQRQLYLAELRRSRKLVDALSDDPSALRKNKITILAALTRLRQICCHPALAKGKAGLGSGKFDALFELLEPLLAEGHKVLLFSQFVECLKLIELEMARRDIAHHKLTGQTTQREAVVRAFQDDEQPCVFLISLKAGGTGLNLTAASYVILFDPWWNPAVEAQAIDRTHRIGQNRTVIAYRMLTRGTIEERIWELQQKKTAMASDILGEDGFARALSHDDLSFLLQEV